MPCVVLSFVSAEKENPQWPPPTETQLATRLAGWLAGRLAVSFLLGTPQLLPGPPLAAAGGRLFRCHRRSPSLKTFVMQQCLAASTILRNHCSWIFCNAAPLSLFPSLSAAPYYCWASHFTKLRYPAGCFLWSGATISLHAFPQESIVNNTSFSIVFGKRSTRIYFQRFFFIIKAIFRFLAICLSVSLLS